MQAVVRTSPDRLATWYGLLTGGAQALLAVAPLSLPLAAPAAPGVALSLLSWVVLVGSVLLFVHLGYVAGSQGGTTGVAVGPGIKAGILFSLVTYVGLLVYLAGSGWLFREMTDGAVLLVFALIVVALLSIILAALIGAGLAMLGAAAAQHRARA
jgi:hypothetical protein